MFHICINVNKINSPQCYCQSFITRNAGVPVASCSTYVRLDFVVEIIELFWIHPEVIEEFLSVQMELRN